jgi:predicted ATPase
MKLKEMGLIEEFEVNPIAKQRQEYEVKVHTKGSNDWVDLPDVGFGISQVLPVLVQCYFAPQNSIILMEQPEIHLHPLAQSALADVMIDVINSKVNMSTKYPVNYRDPLGTFLEAVAAPNCPAAWGNEGESGCLFR